MADRLFVILPAYNEQDSLPSLLQKLEAFAAAQPALQVQLIVVNDGSTDETATQLAQYSGPLQLHVITHKLNRGLGETARDGFELAAELAAPDDVIVRMDCDDTHEPRYMEQMLAKLQDGYDIVIASRYQPGGGALGVNLYRRFISRVAGLTLKTFFPIPGIREYSCGFRAYRAEYIQASIRIFGNQFISLTGLGFTCTVEKLIKLRMLGARCAEVPFTLRYDQKLSDSKMVSSITTLGYFVLILKNVYPWGPIAKTWVTQAAEFRAQHGR